MADDRRVEGRILPVGSGMAATPEKIAEMQARAAKANRAPTAKPTTSFAELMRAKRGDGAGPESEPDEAQQKPKRGPKPALTHPEQRRDFGRAEDERVVLKG